MYPAKYQILTLCIFALGVMTLGSSPVVQAQPPQTTVAQPSVKTNRAILTLAGAERAIAASRKQAEAMGASVNIAVVDEGGHLLAFARMDDARPSSIYTSITKATSAATRRAATGPAGTADLNSALESAAAASGGKFTTLKGGVPIFLNGQVIGAVGVGGTTGEQDAKIAAAGVVAVATSSQDPGNDELMTSLFSNWLIEDIEGRGVVDRSQTTIQINQDSSVTGSTGVNRYMSKAILDGQQIKFEAGPATTRMAGAPALMDQEFKFLTAFHKVAQFRIDENGLLHLLDGEGQELLRASPIK